VKKITLRETSANHGLAERLFSLKFLLVIEPEPPEYRGGNREGISLAAVNLGLPFPATLETVTGELDRRGYIEVDLAQEDGVIYRFFINPRPADAKHVLAEYLR